MTNEIGYGKPPKHRQFQKGVSGNPRGRRKGQSNLKTDLELELGEMIQMRRAGGEVAISKRRVLIKSVLAAALEGNMAAATLIINLCVRLMHSDDEERENQITESDRQLLKSYIDGEIAKRNTASANEPGRPDNDTI